jgi:hypothetical protein
MQPEEERWRKWKLTRSRGRNRFILVTGVLGWGLTTAVIWSLLMAGIQGWNRLPTLLPIAIIVFPICGYFFGTFVWKSTETKYYEYLHISDHDQSI